MCTPASPSSFSLPSDSLSTEQTILVARHPPASRLSLAFGAARKPVRCKETKEIQGIERRSFVRLMSEVTHRLTQMNRANQARLGEGSSGGQASKGPCKPDLGGQGHNVLELIFFSSPDLLGALER